MKKNKVLLILFIPILIVISVGLSGMILASINTGKRHILILNTWNDFPLENATDVDAMPAQALHAYLVLNDRGYREDEIYLMLYHPNDNLIDVNGDGENDLPKVVIDVENYQVNKENLVAWLEKISNISDRYDEIIIYIVAHGEQTNGNFSAFSFENGGRITSKEFTEYLKPIKYRKMILLLDFCYSGNFGSVLIKPGRVIVASAEDNKISWYYWNWRLNETDKKIFGSSGSVFFHPFWNKVKEGATIQEAYQYGREKCLRWSNFDPKSKNIIQNQNPQIYTQERTICEEFVFFYPGGFEIFIFTTIAVILIEIVILFAIINEIRFFLLI